jgi:hypothetical protein
VDVRSHRFILICVTRQTFQHHPQGCRVHALPLIRQHCQLVPAAAQSCHAGALHAAAQAAGSSHTVQWNASPPTMRVAGSPCVPARAQGDFPVKIAADIAGSPGLAGTRKRLQHPGSRERLRTAAPEHMQCSTAINGCTAA